MNVIVSKMVLQMKNTFVRPMYRFCLFASPIANTILLYYMFRNSGNENFMTYVILGGGLTSFWECICFSSASDIDRERWYGTLSITFAAPVSFERIVLGMILGNTVLSLATLVISYLTAWLLFGGCLVAVNVWLLLLTLIAVIAAFVALSAVIAYILTLSRKSSVYINCISIPIYLVCGFALPIDVLPAWLLPLSYALPPTWAVKLLRMCFDPASFDAGEYWRSMAILAALVVIYAVLGRLLYRVIDKRVRTKATLDLA